MSQKILVLFSLSAFALFRPHPALAAGTSWWKVQSVDTMKYSRDQARVSLANPQLHALIDSQISLIASSGATHVAIATPYDPEFFPVLSAWVRSARNHHLHVWFRGNWSGWEGWFNYPRISRQQHLELTRNFLFAHSGLFESGDIFTACPECENGGSGDPRQTGDVEGFRNFLLDHYRLASQYFSQQGLAVISNYQSMNADIARLVMDQPTTAAVGGIVVVDHYVKNPDQLAADLSSLAKLTGGQIVLGEFGAPLPDLHPGYTPAQQADWLDRLLDQLSRDPSVIGLNYWVSMGGSTQIWTESGVSLPAASVLRRYYSPTTLTVRVQSPMGAPLSAVINYHQHRFSVPPAGKVDLPVYSSDNHLIISSTGYKSQTADILTNSQYIDIVMQPTQPSLFYRLKYLIYRITHSII